MLREMRETAFSAFVAKYTMYAKIILYIDKLCYTSTDTCISKPCIRTCIYTGIAKLEGTGLPAVALYQRRGVCAVSSLTLK